MMDFEQELNLAVDYLKEGKIVGVPTETVYGLAVDGCNPKAIEALYEIKGREANKPFVFQVATLEEAQKLILHPFSEFQLQLVKKYWPGEVTFVFYKNDKVSDIATAKKNTIAIRISKNVVINTLIKLFNGPIAVPSANLAGEIPAKSDKEAQLIFGDKVAFYLKNNDEVSDVASTIVDVKDGKIVVLRQGKVMVEI